jgi:hypothetical protein
LAGAGKELVYDESAGFLSNKIAAMACEAALPRRIQDEHAGAALAASRIPIENLVFFGTEKKGALVPTYTDPTKMARVDLREVKNESPAACGSLCMELKKISCPRAHVAAAKAGVDLLNITSSVLKTAHWKQLYKGMDYPLASTAQIEAHAGLYDEPICLHPAFKRPKGRPKSMRRKAGYMGKAGQEAHLYLPGVLQGGTYQEKLPRPCRRGRTSALGGKHQNKCLSPVYSSLYYPIASKVCRRTAHGHRWRVQSALLRR